MFFFHFQQLLYGQKFHFTATGTMEPCSNILKTQNELGGGGHLKSARQIKTISLKSSQIASDLTICDQYDLAICDQDQVNANQTT
jgi:hypothetical protein